MAVYRFVHYILTQRAIVSADIVHSHPRVFYCYGFLSVMDQGHNMGRAQGVWGVVRGSPPILGSQGCYNIGKVIGSR